MRGTRPQVSYKVEQVNFTFILFSHSAMLGSCQHIREIGTFLFNIYLTIENGKKENVADGQARVKIKITSSILFKAAAVALR